MVLCRHALLLLLLLLLLMLLFISIVILSAVEKTFRNHDFSVRLAIDFRSAVVVLGAAFEICRSDPNARNDWIEIQWMPTECLPLPGLW